MLILTRRVNQAIMIGDDVKLIILHWSDSRVHLGFEADRAIPIHRLEIYNKIHEIPPVTDFLR